MRIEAKVEDFGLRAALSVAGQRAKSRAAKVIKAVSFAVEKRVKNEMPVDKGRARASWGHWTPVDVLKPGSGANRSDAHWATRDDGLTVEQGSNVFYIAGLNQGNSTQAPAGFIDRAAEAGARELTVELQKEVSDLL